MPLFEINENEVQVDNNNQPQIENNDQPQVENQPKVYQSYEEKYAPFKDKYEERMTSFTGDWITLDAEKGVFLDVFDFQRIVGQQVGSLIYYSNVSPKDVKNHLFDITKDVLKTVQNHAEYKHELKRHNYTEMGLVERIDGNITWGLKNKDLFGEEETSVEKTKLLLGFKEKDVFNKLFTPRVAGESLDAAFNDNYFTKNPSNEKIAQSLFLLASVKKIHDNRPFFGRPENYKEEGTAINDYKEKLMSFGLTRDDIDKAFNAKDEDLEKTIDNVIDNRFVRNNGRIDPEDLSNDNIPKLSTTNLARIYREEVSYISGANSASHSIRLLNAYRAARQKYNSAGFFKKYFTKDYRDLNKSLKVVETKLTATKNAFGYPTPQKFSKQALNELANREQPLDINNEADIKYLDEHNISTFQGTELKKRQQELEKANQVVEEKKPVDIVQQIEVNLEEEKQENKTNEIEQKENVKENQVEQNSLDQIVENDGFSINK